MDLKLTFLKFSEPLQNCCCPYKSIFLVWLNWPGSLAATYFWRGLLNFEILDHFSTSLSSFVDSVCLKSNNSWFKKLRGFLNRDMPVCNGIFHTCWHDDEFSHCFCVCTFAVFIYNEKIWRCIFKHCASENFCLFVFWRTFVTEIHAF